MLPGRYGIALSFMSTPSDIKDMMWLFSCENGERPSVFISAVSCHNNHSSYCWLYIIYIIQHLNKKHHADTGGSMNRLLLPALLRTEAEWNPSATECIACFDDVLYEQLNDLH
jgi:hypothetical protein